VHALGMKYLLWYSVPFVGVHTKAFERFKDKFLSPPKPDGKAQWFTLDPRFPDVREYLIDIYERASAITTSTGSSSTSSTASARTRTRRTRSATGATTNRCPRRPTG
jgi:hypothetical protein